MTHEQYLDEPGEVIEWMLRIAELRKQVGGGHAGNRPA